MKKKIGLVLRTKPGAGGAFQYNLAILEALADVPKSKFEIVVAYTNNSWVQYLKEYGLSSVFLPWSNLQKLFWLGVRTILPITWWHYICSYFHPIAKILLEQKCDLWILTGSDNWAYQMPINSLVTIYDLMHRYERKFPEAGSLLQYYLRENNNKYICSLAKGIIVDSQVGKQQLRESYKVREEKIHVLPYIAPKYIYDSQNKNIDHKFYEKYPNLPEKFIFYPAQFWEHKNHKRLIQAMVFLISKHDIHLVFVGTPKNAYSSILELVKKLDLNKNIHFFGYVPNDDIPDFYKQARAMIMPSFFGPTNIPPLEAIALGCPTAVSDIYGMREQLGNAALYFNPYSVEEISDTLTKLWIDDKLCENLSEQGFLATQEWNQSHFNQKLLKIINQIL